MFGSFFEQDHLLNLTILGVYAERWPKCAQTDVAQNLFDIHFSNLDLTIVRILSEENMGVCG